MEERDVAVVGGGVSGLAFACRAAASGREVLLLEQADTLGGCLDSRRVGDFWFEMGAHTCYNTYRAFLDLAEQSGVLGSLRARSAVRKRFGLLRDGRLSVMGPLSVFLHFDWWELARSVPWAMGRAKAGQTVSSYFGRLVGKGNYRRILGPFLSAVPSQNADAFPVEGPGSLFKKRQRRQEIARSYTLEGGLGTVVAAAARVPGIAVRTGFAVAAVEPWGRGYLATMADGRQIGARVMALAVPVSTAAGILRGSLPELSGQLARVNTVAVESLGVVVAKNAVALPPLAFLVSVNDLFYSVVTRDVLPDREHRGFAFHFRPGVSRERKLERIAQVLGLERESFQRVEEKNALLPCPQVGHDRVVAEVDRILAGGRLAVTGNFFAGMAIEDCVERSFAEWERVKG
jgi:protoporphyrinogen/coproporphyrinogen III oxidase